MQVCRWLEAAGADAIHVSSGSTFPHPENPAGEFALEDMVRSYDIMLSSGKSTFRNYLLFRLWPANRVMQKRVGARSRRGAGALAAGRARGEAGGRRSR